MADQVMTADIGRMISKTSAQPKGELATETDVEIDWNAPQEGLEVDISAEYAVIGYGNTDFNEAPNSQTKESAYTNQKSKSTTIVGYNFAMTGNYEDMTDESAVESMKSIPYGLKTGEDAQRTLVLIDTKETVGIGDTSMKARLFRVAVSVGTINGPGADMRTFDFTLSAAKDPVLGVYDSTAKTFTVKKEQTA